MSTFTRARPGWRRPGAMQRAVATAAVGLSVAVVAAGCSGGSGGSAGGGAAPGVTDAEVKVAIIVPKTGPSAPTFDGFQQGIEARFAEANASGGVHGRKIKTVVLDDAGDGAQQVTAGRNAVQSEKAFGVIGASRVDTMFSYLKQNSVPVVGFPGQPPYATDRNVFGAYGAWAMKLTTTAYAQAMKDRGVTRVAVFSHNSPGATNSANAFVFAAEKLGLKVGMKQFDIPLGAFDATALGVRMKQLGIDGIFTGNLSQSNVAIIQAAKQQGVPLKGTYVTYDPSVVAQAAKTLEGVISSTSGTVSMDLDTDAVKQYKASMAKYAPGVDPAGNLFTAIGWISADLFEKGLDLAGESPTRAAFVDNLRQVDDYDGRGLLVEPVSFKPGVTPNGDPVKCYWFEQVKGGKYVPDAEATCGELIKVE